MSQAGFALTISALAGFSTVIGAVVALFLRPSQRVLSFTLGFAAGIMMAVSLSELFPEGCEQVMQSFPTLWGMVAVICACMVGMLSGCMLDVMLAEPAEGSGSLYRLGIFSMLALLLHNLPEGMAVFLSGCNDRRMGLSLGFAIALHNFPEGISVAMPVLASGRGRARAFWLAALSAAAEPFGALIAWLFLAPYITQTGLALVYLGIAGLMLYIAVAELIPASLSYRHKSFGIGGTFCGILVMLFGILLF